MTEKQMKKEIKKVYRALEMSPKEWQKVLNRNFGEKELISETKEQQVGHVLCMIKNILNDEKNDNIEF